MLGVVYILLSILCGSTICRLLFKNLGKPAEEAGLPAFMVKLPAWYLIGTLQLVAAESFQSLSEMWGVRLHSRPTESKSAF